MMNAQKLASLAAACLLALPAYSQEYSETSPDGRLRLEVEVGNEIRWSLSKDGDAVLAPSAVSLRLADGRRFTGGKPCEASRGRVSGVLRSDLYKKKEVVEKYNRLTLAFEDYALEFRVYDEGAAYRFVASGGEDFVVADEQAEFSFPEDCEVTLPYVEGRRDCLKAQFFSSFESAYTRCRISECDPARLAFLPVSVKVGSRRVNITESALTNYPGMYLYGGKHGGDASLPLKPSAAPNTLRGVFAPLPDKVGQGGHNLLQGIVESRHDFIARCGAGAALPWRVLIVADDDARLLDSDLVWLLGDPAVGDFSWVKPGKVAWEWWNDWGLRGVDFTAGVNDATYRHYIDFAASKGVEYVILDEGWAVNKKADLFQVVPEIDLEALVEYGRKKGVGIILWAGYWAFDRDMEEVCRRCSEMGVKGFKVDFLDRDDQIMVDFTRRCAETCARYGLILDLHGMFKPAGLNRTWPNVVNFEGVKGLENMKWCKMSEFDQVTYDVEIPFIRMTAGPMDYTQGAMRNSQKAGFAPNYGEPGSQGTRCRQLAMYTVFEAPLTMLCDSPSNYLEEPECADFIAAVPVVWDETKALGGKIGEWCAVARRRGEVWYVGVLNNWDARELELDLSFIGAGRTLRVFRDGANAHRVGRDYRREELVVPADGKVRVRLAPGGGWTAFAR